MNISKIRPPTGIVLPAPLHNPATAYRDGSPIALSASVVLAANATNKPNVQALKNTTPYPVEISELRFNLLSTGLIVPGCVGVKLNIAGIDVSQDYIPLWLLDESRAVVLGESSGGSAQANSASYYWKLNTPLYLQPGEILSAEFYNYGLVNADITCTITESGRVLIGHPTPGSRILPFIAQFQGAPIDLAFITAAYPQPTTVEDDSTELDLINTTDTSVRVLGFTGRLMAQLASGAYYSDSGMPVIDMLFSANMRTSKGYEITRDLTPFRHLFASDTRFLPAMIELDPGDYVLAQVVAAQGNILPRDSGGGVYVYPTISGIVIPQIGMIGERSVAL